MPCFQRSPVNRLLNYSCCKRPLESVEAQKQLFLWPQFPLSRLCPQIFLMAAMFNTRPASRESGPALPYRKKKCPTNSISFPKFKSHNLCIPRSQQKSLYPVQRPVKTHYFPQFSRGSCHIPDLFPIQYIFCMRLIELGDATLWFSLASD